MIRYSTVNWYHVKSHIQKSFEFIWLHFTWLDLLFCLCYFYHAPFWLYYVCDATSSAVPSYIYIYICSRFRCVLESIKPFAGHTNAHSLLITSLPPLPQPPPTLSNKSIYFTFGFHRFNWIVFVMQNAIWWYIEKLKLRFELLTWRWRRRKRRRMRRRRRRRWRRWRRELMRRQIQYLLHKY